MLTAAHCVHIPRLNGTTNETKIVKLPKESLEIVAGDHTQSKDEGTEQTVPVKEYIVHPGFWKNVKSEGDNDFAIIKLAKEVKFTKHVNPICLPQPNSNKNFDSVEATASGWGNLLKYNGSGSDILQKVHVYISIMLQIL